MGNWKARVSVTIGALVTLKSHQRQLVDGSDPVYIGHVHSILPRVARPEQRERSGCRKDLNYPPTAVGGIIDLKCYKLDRKDLKVSTHSGGVVFGCGYAARRFMVVDVGSGTL